jgi:hypothetical protein
LCLRGVHSGDKDLGRGVMVERGLGGETTGQIRGTGSSQVDIDGELHSTHSMAQVREVLCFYAGRWRMICTVRLNLNLPLEFKQLARVIPSNSPFNSTYRSLHRIHHMLGILFITITIPYDHGNTIYFCISSGISLSNPLLCNQTLENNLV